MAYDFSRKHALLDTNIIKEILKKGKPSERFSAVITFLQEVNAPLFIIEETKFEFLGYALGKQKYEEFEAWISGIDILPTGKEDVELATRLASMYKTRNPNISPKQISLVDCLHAVQVLKYKGNAFIVTTDLNDYPSFLFDMEKYFPIESNFGEVSFVGMKTFNLEKFRALQQFFDDSARA